MTIRATEKSRKYYMLTIEKMVEKKVEGNARNFVTENWVIIFDVYVLLF